MRKFTLVAIATLIIAGCSKNQFEPAKLSNSGISETVSEIARKDFSVILSRAVSADKNLRRFIKENALKQFDMDYDVFYPYVKNQVVSGDNITFRDVLLQYAENTSSFEEIERQLPLLTILVPDWSYIRCFSVLEWDSESPDIAVGYETKSENKPIYTNGKWIGNLTEGAIPGFPTLIVKDSDRLRIIKAATKSSENEYAFIDDAFDASIHPQTKVEHIYTDVNIDGTPDVSEFIPEDNVPEIIKTTYTRLKDNPYAIQRDYIYFGISPEHPIGKVNTHIKEYIHKLKFKNFTLNGYLEDSDDFIDKDHRWEYKKNDSAKSAQELRDHFYSDGNIELNLNIIIPYKDGHIYQTRKVVTANFGDVFAIDHANLDHRHKTWFCKDWYVYTIEDSYIKPKWFIVDIDLPQWRLDSESDIISIDIEEVDPSEEKEREVIIQYNESETNEVSGGVEGGVDAGINVSGNITVSHSHTSGTNKTEKTIIKSTVGSDNLGIIELDFLTPVVKSKCTKNGQKGYNINTVSTGTIDLMIMPKEI